MTEIAAAKIHLQIFDEKGLATGQIAVAAECPDCHALTLAPNFHAKWHRKLEQRFQSIPPHNYILDGPHN